MIPILSGNVASATAGGYEVANSCRFNDGDSPDLQKTNGSSGNRKTWTFSAWIKRGVLGTTQNFFSGGTDGDNQNYTRIQFNTDNDIYIAHVDGGSTATEKQTDMKFRDVSAWYHIVWVLDTTQGTAANREKLYVNGVQVTSFSTNTIPAEDYETTMNENVGIFVGNQLGTWEFFDGYMAEVCFIDGQALTPTSFGEFDEDSPTIWKPIDVSGLTFGTNGFYLDFEASDNLGNDANGGTDFTETNLAATDQAVDSPTNNFCTMNPLDNYYANATLSEGNLKVVTGSSREASSSSTFYLTQGKWFWETKFLSSSAPFVGIQPVVSSSNTATAAVLQTNGLGILKTGKVETTDGSGGSTELASYDTFTTNDIIGVALDLDGNKIYFYKNGSILGESGVSITDPASTTNGHYMVAIGCIAGTDTISMNFGNPAFSISSGNADDNGYGNFEYEVPSGYYALCTKNLAEFG